MSAVDARTAEEHLALLFQIFRTMQQGNPVGHDLAMKVRMTIRRALPDAYADVMRRWPDTQPSKIRKPEEPGEGLFAAERQR